MAFLLVSLFAFHLDSELLLLESTCPNTILSFQYSNVWKNTATSLVFIRIN